MSSGVIPPTRANPLEGLDDFQPKPGGARRAVPTAVIDAVAAAEGFPSRLTAARSAGGSAPDARGPASAARGQAPAAGDLGPGREYRYTTGRSVQLNIKATVETKERLARLAGVLQEPMTAVVERALLELDQRVGKRKP